MKTEKTGDERVIKFPLAGGGQAFFSVSRGLTAEEFKTVSQVIKLAEKSFIDPNWKAVKRVEATKEEQ